MFEVEEEVLLEIASEWEVDIDVVRQYASILLNSKFIKDEDTFYRLLVTAVNLINPISVDIVTKKQKQIHLSRKEILTTAIKDTFNEYSEEEIKEEVDNLLSIICEKRK